MCRLIGFLFGASAAGAASYLYLLDEYQASSSALLNNVESLGRVVGKVNDLWGNAMELITEMIIIHAFVNHPSGRFVNTQRKWIWLNLI